MHRRHEKVGGGGVRFDGVITDPPYSSGGPERQITARTADKYTSLKRGANPLPDFDGDTMDARVWMGFMADVLRLARGLCVPGAVCCAFADWRRVPALADAFQRAGWYLRGVVVWDKTEGVRPQKGRFRQQAEFIVWGSNGALSTARDVPVLPGVYRHPNVCARKLHQTQKPLELMREICRIVPAGGTVLDPFLRLRHYAGSCAAGGAERGGHREQSGDLPDRGAAAGRGDRGHDVDMRDRV